MLCPFPEKDHTRGTESCLCSMPPTVPDQGAHHEPSCWEIRASYGKAKVKPTHLGHGQKMNFNLSNPRIFKDAGPWSREGQGWLWPTLYQLDFMLFLPKVMNEDNLWKATCKLISEIVIPICLLYVTYHGTPGSFPAMTRVPPQFLGSLGLAAVYRSLLRLGGPWVPVGGSPHGLAYDFSNNWQ